MKNSSSNFLYPIYLATFFFTLHYGLTLYVNSTYLSQFLGERSVDLLYSLASLLSILALAYLPPLYNKFGQLPIALALIGLLMAGTYFLAYAALPLAVILFFLLLYVSDMSVSYNFDLYLEKFSRDKETGYLRAIYLTVINLAILISPFLAGQIVSRYGFQTIYLTALGLAVPSLLVVLWKLSRVKDLAYDRVPFWRALAGIRENKNLYHIFWARFLLEFFYAWMIIYTPVYLTRYIGFSWQEIGIIFPIMLLPFVLLELPLGKLADKYWGEKEILTAGFFIISIFTAALAFVTVKEIYVWAGLLFLTRVGASMIEIMTESYFYKHVSARNTNAISFFKDSRPLAFFVAPLLGSFFLSFASYQTIYLILAFITLTGLYHTKIIEDTK